MAVITAEQATEHEKTFSFEKLWAALMEDRKQHDKNERRLTELHEKAERELVTLRRKIEREQTDRELAEQHKEIAQELAELRRETERAIREASEQGKKADRRIAEMTKAIGEIHDSTGEIVRTLVSARIWKKFKGYRMERVFLRMPIYDGDNRHMAEVDVLLSGTMYAIAVAVKRQLQKRNVDFHVRCLELVQKYPPAEIKLDGKTLMGAVAGGTVSSKVRDYAHENGLFVIELSEKTACLVPTPAGFKPREWP
jgi:exonuclease VII large subunit